MSAQLEFFFRTILDRSTFYQRNKFASLAEKNETKRTFWPFSSSSIYLGECRYRFCVSRETPSFYWDDLVKIRAYTKSSGQPVWLYSDDKVFNKDIRKTLKERTKEEQLVRKKDFCVASCEMIFPISFVVVEMTKLDSQK